MSDKIFVSLPGENEFQVLQADDARQTATRLGIEAEIAHAENHAIEQIQQIFRALHAETPPKAVVVEPVASEGLERLARKAAAAGIGWAELNSTSEYIRALRAEFPLSATFTVGSDQVEIGRLQADQMRALLPQGGTALYLVGLRGSAAAEERLKGTNERLAGGNIQLLLLDAQWSEESAERALRSWQRLKSSENAKVDLVAAQNDSMAHGARSAIASDPNLSGRLSSVPFLGIDGVPSVGQAYVKSGQQTATIIMPSNTGPAISAATRWLRSQAMPEAAIRVAIESMPGISELRPVKK